MSKTALLVAALAALAWGAQAEPVIVPYDAFYEPMSFTGDEGEADGFDVAVARELAERIDLEVEFIAVDFFDIQAGDWPDDWGFTVASMSRDPVRDEAFDFIGPYVFDTIIVIAAPDAPAQGVAELQDIEIGVCSGCIYKAYLEGDYLSDDGSEPPIPGAVPRLFTTDPDILRAIADPDSGLDYGITSAFHADYYISAGAPIRKLDPPLFLGPLWIAVPKGSDELFAELEVAFEEIRQDGTLSELAEQYLMHDYTKRPGE